MSSAAAPHAPMQGAQLALVSFALALGTFMQVLDSTIANVSLPTIAGNLGASTSQGSWVVTSFAVANGVTVPLTGWLMGRFGVVRTFVVSVVLFTIASLLCGLAWNLESLVFFRVVQGMVSGPMIPGSQGLLMAIFPPHRRSTAFGVWSMTTLIGPILGPILGGYISDNYHWSWIFLINVPVGIFCAIVCWRGLKSRETPTRKLPIDKMGIALLFVWVGALQIMLDKGKDEDWFHSPLIIGLLVVAVLVFLVWLIWELTEKHPAVDLSLFLKSRSFAVGTLVFCLGYAVFFANVLVMPIWMQTQLGYTATWAGLVTAPSGVVALLLTPLAVWAAHRYDARIVATIAFLAFVLSFYMRSLFTTNDDFWVYALPLAVQGIGMSGFFLGMLAIQLDRIDPMDIPAATGLSNFARITAGGFAASITMTLYDRREAMHQSQLVEHFTPYSPNFQQTLNMLEANGIGREQGVGMIMQQLVQQAYLLSATDIFWLSSMLALAMVGFIWLARRPSSENRPPPSAE